MYINLQKTQVDHISFFKIQQWASALVISQRLNFTIANCSASVDCENGSFGHCLVGCMSLIQKTEVQFLSRPTAQFLSSFEKIPICQTLSSLFWLLGVLFCPTAVLFFCPTIFFSHSHTRFCCLVIVIPVLDPLKFLTT